MLDEGEDSQGCKIDEKVVGMAVVKYEPKNDVKKHGMKKKKTMEKVSKNIKWLARWHPR